MVRGLERRCAKRVELCKQLAALALASSIAAGVAGTASAQPDERASDAASIVPPELLKFESAEYPAQALSDGREADVVLALDIDGSGRVTRAEVVEPVGYGFDEAASAAALKFVFQPARRGGAPVPARILYRYSFKLQPAETRALAPPPRAALRGTINEAGSKAPLAGAQVTLLRDGRPVFEVRTNERGQFEVPELEPGRYVVRVRAIGFEPYTAQEELAPEEELTANYGLIPASEGLTVTVESSRPAREVTRRTLSRRELARMPGTSGDALRALQNMPGVARPPSLSGILVVRGNANETTPVLVDGIWIPNIYHFGGLSSVVPTELLDEVNFYPGNFSVKYGRALAGVVDAHLRETRGDDRYHGLAQIDLIDGRLMLEGPVPLVGGWHFIGGIRRSHLDAWLTPLLEDRNTSIAAAPVYYDYQLLFDHRPSPDSYWRIGLLGFDDRFRIVNQSSAALGEFRNINSSWGIGVMHSSKLSDDARIDLTFAVARNRVLLAVGPAEFDTTAYGNIVRGELEWRPYHNTVLRAGYDVLVAPYTVTAVLPEADAANAPVRNSPLAAPAQVVDRDALMLLPAAYLEFDMRPNRRTQVVTGIRTDYTFETQRVDVAPRMTGRYDVVPESPKTTLKAGTGLFFQAPGFFERVLKDDDTQLRSQRSFQNSVGVEQELGDGLSLSVEGFFNLLDELITRVSTPDGSLRYSNQGTGRIFGAETLLRYDAGEQLFGWISYTLSRSERTWVPGEDSRLFDLDQTHILTALGSYQLGKGWELGARFRYVTGNLYTPCSGRVWSSLATSYLCVSGDELSERLPPFHQLDLRVQKKWTFSEFSIAAYLDLLNAYNRKNPDFMQYRYDYAERRAQSGSLPIVPSLGVRGEF